MNEKTKLINPTTAYFHGDFAKQLQEAPGLQNLMEPRPDCGEKSYIGHDRLAGRKMLVTGGDSGIGPRGRNRLCAGGSRSGRQLSGF